jgi:transcriptional regulator with XRE-family HTH domain
MKFGEFVKNRRLSIDLGLREFCSLAKVDPSNWSKIERGILAIPDDRSKLERIARLLKLKEKSPDWFDFFDLAYVSRKQIPDQVYEDEEVLSALPIFFRTARGEKPTKEQMKRIAELLRRR